MKTRRVDPDDLARLGMDTPNNPMVVTAVVRLDGPIAADALLELVESRVLVHERMRARIESAGLLPRAPRWREVDARARDYVTPVTLAPSPASDADLADLVSDLTARPLDPGRAPWHLWHVDGGGVSALVLRVHHAVADGLALLALLFAFSD